MRKHIGKLLFFSLLLFHYTSSHCMAWGLSTHLYIGRAVLDDLDDGAVHLCASPSDKSPLCEKQYKVPKTIADAIKLHPDAYLSGHLGPDVFPDFVSSQLTVHPGVKDGWGSDKWLEFLFSRARLPQEIAWVSGVTGHAAGDVFGHSWVNMYSGGVFDIVKSLKKKTNIVETRHILLERYIDAIVNRNSPHTTTATGDAPRSFVVDTLILEDSVNKQYEKSGPFASHLMLFGQLFEKARALQVRRKQIDERHYTNMNFLSSGFLQQYLNLEKEELDGWSEDLRNAAIAYVAASESVANNILVRQRGGVSDEPILKPYTDWLSCHESVFYGIPVEVSQFKCKVKDDAKAWKKSLLVFLRKVLPPSLVAVLDEYEKVKGQVKEQLKTEGKQLVTVWTSLMNNESLGELLLLLSEQDSVSVAQLESALRLSLPEAGIVGLSQPLRALHFDLGVANEETLSERQLSEFAPLRNSIVLAKLALLSADELSLVFEELLQHSALRPLYSNSPSLPHSMPFGLLFQSIRSIDGNHQWQHIGLPYPSSLAPEAIGWPCSSAFGRRVPSKTTHSEFLLWGKPLWRDVVFKQVFLGPMSPGLEAEPDVSSRSRFRACEVNPFPSTTDAVGVLLRRDLTCDLSASIGDGVQGRFPALSQRLVPRRSLLTLGAVDLRVARNEIFARHGYVFGDIGLREYFASQSWYTESHDTQEAIVRRVSQTEWNNVERIKRLEKRIAMKKPVAVECD